jgi:trehalose 6-phosphate phosphatase
LPRRDLGVKDAILAHLRDGGHLTLFLDYDGTLVPIAPTPAEALPDQQLLELLAQLSRASFIRTVIISGRSLEALRRILPVHGLILAGLYGVEMQMADASLLLREPLRHGKGDTIAQVRERWRKLSDGLAGFLIEDKGQAVALHARWAEQAQADRVLAAARDAATDLADFHSYRLLDGDRYIEIAPANANKGETAEWILSQYPIHDDLLVGFGDDNKDEAAFAVIQRRGGYAIGVGHRYPLPDVDERLESPEIVRSWLSLFIASGSNTD